MESRQMLVQHRLQNERWLEELRKATTALKQRDSNLRGQMERLYYLASYHIMSQGTEVLLDATRQRN